MLAAGSRSPSRRRSDRGAGRRMIPKKYLRFIEPLAGVRTMLELGNKRGTEHEPYKGHFEKMGIAHTSIDWNGQDGAIAADLRNPLMLVLEEAVGRSRVRYGDKHRHQRTRFRPGGMLAEHHRRGRQVDRFDHAAPWRLARPRPVLSHAQILRTACAAKSAFDRTAGSVRSPGRRFIGARLKVEKKRHFRVHARGGRTHDRHAQGVTSREFSDISDSSSGASGPMRAPLIWNSKRAMPLISNFEIGDEVDFGRARIRWNAGIRRSTLRRTPRAKR
jgi:hypothetical protein